MPRNLLDILLHARGSFALAEAVVAELHRQPHTRVVATFLRHPFEGTVHQPIRRDAALVVLTVSASSRSRGQHRFCRSLDLHQLKELLEILGEQADVFQVAEVTQLLVRPGVVATGRHNRVPTVGTDIQARPALAQFLLGLAVQCWNMVSRVAEVHVVAAASRPDMRVQAQLINQPPPFFAVEIKDDQATEGTGYHSHAFSLGRVKPDLHVLRRCPFALQLLPDRPQLAVTLITMTSLGQHEVRLLGVRASFTDGHDTPTQTEGFKGSVSDGVSCSCHTVPAFLWRGFASAHRGIWAACRFRRGHAVLRLFFQTARSASWRVERVSLVKTC